MFIRRILLLLLCICLIAGLSGCACKNIELRPEVKLTWVLVLAAGNNSFKTGGKEVDCCKKCLGTGRISCGACWGRGRA